MRYSNIDELHCAILEKLRDASIPEFKGFDIARLLHNQIYYGVTRKRSFLIETIIASIFFERESIDFDSNNPELLLYSEVFNRRDHDTYWDKICNLFDDRTYFKITNLCKGNWKKCLRLGKTFSNLHYLNVFSKHLSFVESKLLRRFLASQLVWFYRFYEKLENYNLNPKVAMCFCDVDFHESFMVQWLRNHNVITVTNQHGQPIFRNSNMDRLNQSQILNFNSDYFLAKGEFTRNMFLKSGTDINKIVVVGDLNSNSYVYSHKDKKSVFGVFLDAPSLPFSSQTNRDLLDLATLISQKYSIHFSVKIHPSDREERYNNLGYNCTFVNRNIPLAEFFDSIDFGLFSASAIYIDMIANSVKAYQFCSAPFPIVENSNDIAESFEDFSKKYEEWNTYTDLEKKEYFYNIFNSYYCETDASGNITDFILNLMNETPKS